MPEELTLLPCPACGKEAHILDAFERDDKGHVVVGWIAQCTRGCLTTGEHGSRETAAASWNALPRALTWTRDPQWGAWNWWRDGTSCIPCFVYRDGQVSVAMPLERIPYKTIGGQWAGPIPEPSEQK